MYIIGTRCTREQFTCVLKDLEVCNLHGFIDVFPSKIPSNIELLICGATLLNQSTGRKVNALNFVHTLNVAPCVDLFRISIEKLEGYQWLGQYFLKPECLQGRSHLLRTSTGRPKLKTCQYASKCYSRVQYSEVVFDSKDLN